MANMARPEGMDVPRLPVQVEPDPGRLEIAQSGQEVRQGTAQAIHGPGG